MQKQINPELSQTQLSDAFLVSFRGNKFSSMEGKKKEQKRRERKSVHFSVSSSFLKVLLAT